MKNFKITFIISIILSAAMLFGGCNGDDMPAATPTPTPPTVVNNIYALKNTIAVAMPSKIESTNPYLINSRDVLSLYNLVFEPLVDLNQKGEPVPCLAQSWSVDESGYEWTFVLRDGVTWQHINREITAQDVHFTISLMQEIKDNSIHCHAMGYIADWDIVDEKTILITTYEPFYGILMAMNFPILPYDVGYNSAGGEPIVPVGTGPYMVNDYRPGVRIELVQNEAWWQVLPRIEKIIAEPYDIGSIAVSALSLGQLDVVQTNDITVSQLRDSLNVNTYEYNTNYYEFLMPNIGQSPLLRDERVRQAIALAINRQEIVSNVYINHAILTESPVRPSSWLYEGTAIGYDNDIEEAVRLLILSGWKKENPDDEYFNISPDGVKNDFTLILVTNDNEQNSLRYEAAQIIIMNLADIGIKVDFKLMDWDIFEDRIAQGYFDLLLAGWYISDIPDLRSLLASNGRNNISGYADEEMDLLLEDVMDQKTAEGLKNAFKLVHDKINEDVPVISLYFRTHTLLTRSRLINIANSEEGDAFQSIQDWTLIE